MLYVRSIVLSAFMVLSLFAKANSGNTVFKNSSADKCSHSFAFVPQAGATADSAVASLKYTCKSNEKEALEVSADNSTVASLMKAADQVCASKYCAATEEEKETFIPCSTSLIQGIVLHDGVERCQNSPGANPWKSGAPHKSYRVTCSDRSVVEESFFLKAEKEGRNQFTNYYNCRDKENVQKLADLACSKRLCSSRGLKFASNFKKSSAHGLASVVVTKEQNSMAKKVTLVLKNKESEHHIEVRASEHEQIQFLAQSKVNLHVIAICEGDILTADSKSYYKNCSLVSYKEDPVPKAP